MNLNKKKIIISGCSGIYGYEITKYLLDQNADIIGIDIHRKNKKIDYLKKNYQNFKYFNCDVTIKKELLKIKKKIKQNFSQIDTLINLASITDPIEGNRKKITRFEDFSSTKFGEIVTKNVLATFLPCQILGCEMIKYKKGSIINFSSTYGLVGPDQSIYLNKNKKVTFIKNPAYPTSKGAIISFTKYLASYWGEYNIRVNCVVPGGAENNQDKTFINNYSFKTPLGRMANKKDMNGIIHLLCSDESSYITGSTLVVDGGWTSI